MIYVGKAKNLRARAGSYFLKAAAEDPRTAKLVLEIRDIDYLDAESEIDALLMEARLIKDILPKFNRDLRDNKTFPYLEIFTHEDFPRVRFTREPKSRGHEALWAVRQSARASRGDPGVAEDLQVPHLHAGHRRERPALALVSPLPAALDRPMHRPVQSADLERGVPQGHPPLAAVSRRRQEQLLGEMREEMAAAPQELHFEEAGRLRDEIEMLETLDERGELETHVQPEVFPIDPKRGLAGLQKVLHSRSSRGRSKASTWPTLAGTETVAAVVQFIDGLPFKPGYRRMRIRGVDRARRHGQHPRGRRPAVSAHQARRRNTARHTADRRRQGATQCGPGGAGVAWAINSQTVVSLAKREELVFTPDADEPLHLSRHSYALRLLQYVRDEAHRFAQHYHHLLRKGRSWGSEVRRRQRRAVQCALPSSLRRGTMMSEPEEYPCSTRLRGRFLGKDGASRGKGSPAAVAGGGGMEQAGVPYAVVGGNAVAAWVSRVDEAAVRNTQDVDILIRRADLPAAIEAMSKAGFVYRHAAGIEMLLDGPEAKARDAVHLVFAGEKVRPEYVLPAPDVAESEAQHPFAFCHWNRWCG